MVPETWHEALVIAIFKKGDESMCENYRPICLLQAGYKIYAIILLQRLKAAGAESRVWPTQCGCWSGCDTTDTIFVARRHLDEVRDWRDGQLVFLALDWAKACDSVDASSLLQVNQRFRAAEKDAGRIRAIYTGRRFAV